MSWSHSEAAIRSIIPAAKQLGYDALVLEIGGNVVLQAQDGLSAAWSREDVRSLLALATEHGLQVIPCADLLGHTDCNPRHPRFVDRSMGLKLWEPGVYEFLQRYIAEVCELFDGPGYFHARMDEARHAIEVNADRLGVSPAKLLADHVNRVNELVKAQGARLIIYHDMLLSPADFSIGTALGGPPLNTSAALQDIPRDVIINFWLYQFTRDHVGGVEFFTDRGFETWLSPWHHPEPMCGWAGENGLPVIQTTWCDPTSLARYESILRAVAMAARYRRTPGLGSRYDLGYSPLLSAVRLLSPKPGSLGGRTTQVQLDAAASAPPPDGVPDTVWVGDGALDCAPVVLQEARESLDARLEGAPRPLKIIRDDGVEHEVAGINRSRGNAEIILYTPRFGPHPATNMFGGEAVVINGVVQQSSIDVWANSGYLIPPGGCIISGHCSGDVTGFMVKIKTGQRVRLVDAGGADLFQTPADSGELLDAVRLPLAIDDPVRELMLLHATAEALPITGPTPADRFPLVGTVQAGDNVIELRFGADVGCFRVPCWLLGPDGAPSETSTLAWAADLGYADARCLYLTRLRLKHPVVPADLRLSPTAAGLAAGWVIAAVAVVH